MKTIAVAVVALLCLSQLSEGQTTSKADGGSIRTDLGYNIVVNKGSSLRRQWVAFHEDLPLKIEGTPGVDTVYKSQKHRGDYNYTAQATLSATQAVTAVEVRFVTIDVFGERMTTLSATEIQDIVAGEKNTFKWSWNAYRENDVSRFFASIAFIAKVRTTDGQVHWANSEAILEVVKQFAKEATASDLHPSADKP